MTEAAAALASWETRCKAHGLSVTTPRRAILHALLNLDSAHDAVAVLQVAREHHAGTSLGTVYRFLRELEQAGLVQTQAQARGRMRWKLQEPPSAAATDDIRLMLQQMRHFLHELERLGLADPVSPQDAASVQATAVVDNPSNTDMLRRIAGHFSYRLA